MPVPLPDVDGAGATRALLPSTQRHLTSRVPSTDPGAVIARMLRSQDDPARRLAEGGLRLSGRYKASRPGVPLVSVVTICLNAAPTLEQAIRSVLDQSYDNLEYIVVDGASCDGTIELLRRHEASIDYFVSEPDGGLYRAMNKALGLATGEHVLVLNADDWYAPDAVGTLVRARDYSGKDFVSALAQYVDADGRPDKIQRSMPFDASMRLRMPLRHETMLVPRWVYDRFGPYDETLRIVADFAFTLKLYEAGLTHYEVPRPLLHFRQSGISSTDLTLLGRERRRLLHAQFPGLADDELDTLEVMGRLKPASLAALAERHGGDDALYEALRCYQRDQDRRDDAPAWRRHPVDWPSVAAAHRRPRVSVILPVYDAEDTLDAAIESVRNQTLADIELICINDATPDNSQALLERQAAQDPRLRLLVNETNLGLGATRNRGMAAARGDYVFQLDPDDTLPPEALERLLAVATKHGSQMVKGAYLREQTVHGRGQAATTRHSLCGTDGPWINTDLRRTPALLRTTEGHWSYLYETGFARRVAYPTDLKMGQDSIFLVQALARANAVSVVDDVVYRYGANQRSAMNTFHFRKYGDAVEWRRRAWHVLVDFGHRAVARQLLVSYWSDDYFLGLMSLASDEQRAEIYARLRDALREAGLAAADVEGSPLVRSTLVALLSGADNATIDALLRGGSRPGGDARPRAETPTAPSEPPLRVATWCSMDHGGAGTGTQRRVAALRTLGIAATIHSLVVRSGHAYVSRVVPRLPGIDNNDQAAVWKEVRARAIQPASELPGFCAAELFSSPAAVVQAADFGDGLEGADVVHMHWVVGMLDLETLPASLADKPVVWTLADMNAFTGGCHYSEGCEGYRQECHACPLLGGDSEFAHEIWKRKRDAYRQLKHLHIVCPSKWLAKRVAESSLLGDRTVHYIPNAFPVDRFYPTNKLVARLKLGLPLNRKLLLFGADSLENKRKGGQQLRQALSLLTAAANAPKGVEIILFGNKSVSLPLPTHSMGHISDDLRLAQIYSAADAFVFPSHEDNAPLTVGESMLCGTPVVAFPVGNVPDLVTHLRTGYLAKHLDVDDLARGIRWVLAASARAALDRSIECRTAAARFHDPTTAAKRHLRVYKEAMGHV